MEILIDTNVFHDDWFLEKAAWRYLTHFANNGPYYFLVSRVVIQEVENIRRRNIGPAVKNATKALAELAKLTGAAMPCVPGEETFPAYDFLSVLKSRFDWIRVLEYGALPQEPVVSRALAGKRPFQDGEKGYRDTLIWLSLLEYAKGLKKPERIVFISSNVNDFFDPSDKKSFHPDLLEDLALLPAGVVITPFRSLQDFVDVEVDKDVHAIDYSKAAEFLEGYVEEEGSLFLDSSAASVVAAFENSFPGSGDALSSVTSVTADVFEGVEDFSIISTRELGGDEVFVTCEYNLRIVVLDFELPLREYERNKRVIEESGAFFESGADGTRAVLKAIVRPYFGANLVYNRKTGESSAFEVTRFSLR